LRKYFLIVFLFIVSYAFCQQPDTLVIKAGHSVDSITLLKRPRADLKKMKNEKFAEDKGHGTYPGRIGPSLGGRWITYKNDRLTLEFYTPVVRWPEEYLYKRRLQSITVTKNAKTTEGLIIGKSTKENVIALYGQPHNLNNHGELISNDPNSRYLMYMDRGISFHFSELGIITEISIFPPDKFAGGASNYRS
jgi:hypothetical protein